MSQAEDIRLETRTGTRHQDGRPFHYPSLNQDDRIRPGLWSAGGVPVAVCQRSDLGDVFRPSGRQSFVAIRRPFLPERRRDAAVDPLRTSLGNEGSPPVPPCIPFTGILCVCQNHKDTLNCPWPIWACATIVPIASWSTITPIGSSIVVEWPRPSLDDPSWKG